MKTADRSLAPHPRLLFTAAELTRLRKEARRGLRATVLQQLRRACDRLMDPSDPWYLDFREQKKSIWRERRGIFVVLPSINALSACYAFTGDRQIGNFARDAVVAIVEDGLADVKAVANGSAYMGWRHRYGHDKGKFAQCMAWAYDFCFDRFSKQQRERLADYAKESIQLAAKWADFDQAQVSNNRGVRGILASTWWCLAFEGDTTLPEAEAWYERGLVAAEKYLFMAHDADGAPYEGPGYASSLAFITFSAEALRRRGYPDLQTNNRFERIAEYMLYELLPGGGSVNNLNDCEEVCGSIAGCLPLMGTPRGRLLPWLTRQLDFHPSRSSARKAASSDPVHYQMGEHMLYFLLGWKDAPVKEPRSLGYPLSRCFRTRGVASMRTGWKRGDWLVSHFSGRQERSCHRQGDYNHVSFYALGEKFLVDAGYGHKRDDWSKPVDRWFGLTNAHNCVLIDGAQQRGVVGAPGWAEGELLDFQHTKEFDTSLGDASSATGPDHRIQRALRRVTLVRTGPKPYVAIVDVNENDGRPFLAEALWHTHFDNRIELDGSRFWIRGRENDCFGQVLWPRNARSASGTDHLRPQLRVAVKSRLVEMVTIFCPVPRGANPPRFSCARESEGRFIIHCEDKGRKSTLHANAVTREPLRRPLPIRLFV